MKDLIRECSASLEEFRYGLLCPVIDDVVDISLDFSSCERLRDITLDVPVFPRGFSAGEELNRLLWTGLATTFSAYAPPNLERLYLIIDQGSGRLKQFEYNTLEIINLESVLLNLRSLRRVHLIPTFQPYADEYNGEEDAEQVAKDANIDITGVGPNGWIDRVFSVKLFPRLILDNKLIVEGEDTLFPILRSFVQNEAVVETKDPLFDSMVIEDFMQEVKTRQMGCGHADR